ncbi:LamG-like jellyroll fold domain-containing protein [Nonlabens spongiae]|nr:LamG-like jellyroll fold domain-containing protein [Nonlabens spongiae]
MKTRLLSLMTCLIAYIAMAQVDVRTQNISVDLDATGNASITAQDIDNGSVSVTGMDYVNGPEINIVGSGGGEIAFGSGFATSSSNGLPLSIAASHSSFQTSPAFDGVKVRVGDYIYLRCTLNNGSRPSNEILGFNNGSGRVTWGGSTTGTFANRSQYLIEQDGKTQGDLIDFSLPFSMRLLVNSRYLGQSGSVFDDFATPQPLTIDLVSGDPGFEDATSGLSLSLDQTTFDCEEIEGQDQRALNFQSGAQGISLGNVSDFLGSFTTEMWINTNMPNQMLMAKWRTGSYGRFHWYIQSDGKIRIATNRPPFDSTVIPSSTTNVADGQWHHIACVYEYDNSTSLGVLKIYVDGTLEDTSNPVDISPSANGQILQIGTEENPSPTVPNFTSGLMDDIRIWETARTAAQINEGIYAPVNPTTEGLISYYSFDGTSNQLEDLTGNQLPISINNTNITQTLTAGSPVAQGILVTLTGTDSASNSATGNVFVNVVDNTSPILTCPSDINVEATSTSGETVKFDFPTVSDNCETGGVAINALETLAPDGMSFLDTYNGSAYFISDAADTGVNNFAFAKAQGYNLITINDADEESFLTGALTAAGANNILIGYNDIDNEGTFVWQDGSNSTYTNWRSNEPNNSGDEDYTQLVVLSGAWGWNDTSANSAIKFVVEIPLSGIMQPTNTTAIGTFEGHTYFISNNSASASQAFNNAAQAGYSLASISSVEENQFLQSYLNSNGISDVHIGLNDLGTEGVYAWQNGETFSYSNWASGNPSNSGGAEDYGELQTNGEWNDIPASLSQRYIIEVPSQLIQTAGFESGILQTAGNYTNSFNYYAQDSSVQTCSFNVTIAPQSFPILSNVTIASNNSGNSTIAKANDRIIINAVASEELNNIAVTIAGQTANVSRTPNTLNYSFDISVPRIQDANLSSLPNGIATFTIDFEDQVGNTGTQVTTTTNGSQVTINRTPPTAIAQDVELCPDSSGNYNLTAAAVDDGSNDVDGGVNLTIGTSLTTNRPSISYNQTHINEGSVYFDGNNKRISTTVTGIPTGNAARTIEFWMKPENTGGNQFVVNYGANSPTRFFGVLLQTNGDMILGFNGSGRFIRISGIVSYNLWSHYAISYDNRNFKIYKNGNLITDTNIGFDLNTASSDLFLGNNLGNTNADFRGNLSELRLYDYAKTGTQVLSEYNSYSAGNEPGLIYYNKLNEGTGGAINDGRFNTAGNLAVGGGGSEPVWSTDYPDASFQNEIGTYHTVLAVTDSNGNRATDEAIVILKDDIPIARSQDVTVVLDASGNAVITTAMADDGTISCSGHTLSLTNDTFTCIDLERRASGSVNFEYQSAVVNHSNLPTGNAPRTAMMWVKPNNASVFNSNRTFFMWYGDGALNRLFTFGALNGKLQADMYANNLDTNASIPPGQWSHVAITHDGTTFKLFLNGEQVGEKASTINTTVNSGNSVGIAGRSISTDNRFRGKMADVVMLDYAIDPNELKSFYLNRIDPNQSGLVMYYPLNEQTSAQDLSSPSGDAITLGIPAARNDKAPSADSPTLLDAGPYSTLIATSTTDATKKSSDTFLVALSESELPVITLVGDQNIVLPVNGSYIEQGATATDNCGLDAAGVVIGGDTVDTSTNGTYIVTYNVQDTSGNAAAQVTRTVVVDGIPPGVVDASISSDNSTSSAFAKAGDQITLTFTTSEEVLTPVVQIAGRTATVNATRNSNEYKAQILIPGVNSASMTSLPDGLLNFTIGLTDLVGNDSTGITGITDGSSVTLDRTTPVVTTQNATITLDANGDASITQADVVDTIVETNPDSVIISQTTFTCADTGIQAVLITATDQAGNTAVQNALVNVDDAIAPVLSLNGAATITIQRGVTFIDPGVTVTDNCSSSITPIVGGDTVNINATGSYLVTYNATDLAGNAATEITRTVEVTNGDFIYDNGSWTPNDPTLASNPSTFVDNIIIRESTTLSSVIRTHDLSVETGATLTLSSGSRLIIDNIVTAQAINGPEATILAYGQSSQPWTLNNTVIGTLELANATLNLDGDIRITDKIFNDDTVSNSVLNIAGSSLIFTSSETGTAVIDGANLTINGVVKTENYFADRRAFRFVTPSVQSTTSIYDNWQESGAETSGFGTDITGGSLSNGFDQSGSGNPSMFSWNNSSQQWQAQASTNAPTDLLVPGTPYRLMVRGDRRIDLSNNSSQSSTTLRAEGTLLNSTYSLPNPATTLNEYMMLPNPYQSELPLGAMMRQQFNGSNTLLSAMGDSFYYIWDPIVNTRGAYRTYSRQLDQLIGPSSSDSRFEQGVLKPGQVAFVVASGVPSGSISIPKWNNAIIPPPVSILNQNPSELRLELFEETDYQNNNGSLDQLLVQFSATGNNSFDHLDALKFANLDETLSRFLTSTGGYLVIEDRNLPQAGEELELSLTNLRHSNYVFESQPLNLLMSQAYLVDTFAGNRIALDNSQITTYSFTVDQNDVNSQASNRFRIEFEDVTLSVDDPAFAKAQISLYPNPAIDGYFNLDFMGIEGEKTVQVVDLQGRLVESYRTTETQLFKINTENMAAGVYLVEVDGGIGTASFKVVVE